MASSCPAASNIQAFQPSSSTPALLEDEIPDNRLESLHQHLTVTNHDILTISALHLLRDIERAHDTEVCKIIEAAGPNHSFTDHDFEHIPTFSDRMRQAFPNMKTSPGNSHGFERSCHAVETQFARWRQIERGHPLESGKDEGRKVFDVKKYLERGLGYRSIGNDRKKEAVQQGR